ncbi:hypothetical protein TNCV_2111591 [Trichonephila clavipes]|nr:hypothetical protein TNCV_2111591 [Trichonephila clavipes]
MPDTGFRSSCHSFPTLVPRASPLQQFHHFETVFHSWRDCVCLEIFRHVAVSVIDCPASFGRDNSPLLRILPNDALEAATNHFGSLHTEIKRYVAETHSSVRFAREALASSTPLDERNVLSYYKLAEGTQLQGYGDTRTPLRVKGDIKDFLVSWTMQGCKLHFFLDETPGIILLPLCERFITPPRGRAHSLSVKHWLNWRPYNARITLRLGGIEDLQINSQEVKINATISGSVVLETACLTFTRAEESESHIYPPIILLFEATTVWTRYACDY